MIEQLINQCSDLAAALKLDRNISINSYMAERRNPKEGESKSALYFQLSMKESSKKDYDFHPLFGPMYSPYGRSTACEVGDYSLEEALIKLKSKLVGMIKSDLEKSARHNADLVSALTKLETKLETK